MANLFKIIERVRIGVERIDAQLHLASAAAHDVGQDLWALGYCFGVFDGLARNAGLNQQSDGLVLATVGFQRLFNDGDVGSDQFALAMDSRRDRDFVAGNTKGVAEIGNWLADFKKVPVGLCNRLMERALRPIPNQVLAGHSRAVAGLPVVSIGTLPRNKHPSPRDVLARSSAFSDQQKSKTWMPAKNAVMTRLGRPEPRQDDVFES